MYVLLFVGWSQVVAQVAIGIDVISPSAPWKPFTVHLWPVYAIGRQLEPGHDVLALVSILLLASFPTLNIDRFAKPTHVCFYFTATLTRSTGYCLNDSFFNIKCQSKIFTSRKLALLMFKIDGDNHYQIEQASRSYCLLVLSGH